MQLRGRIFTGAIPHDRAGSRIDLGEALSVAHGGGDRVRDRHICGRRVCLLDRASVLAALGERSGEDMTAPLHDHVNIPLVVTTRYRDGVCILGNCCYQCWPIAGGGYVCGCCGTVWTVVVGRRGSSAT